MSSLKESTVFGIFHKAALPEGAMPVEDFKLEKYLGRWYEVGRMDFFWETRNLTNVYAEYRANSRGTVDVKNTGYDEDKQKWTSYEGEARFRAENTMAALEVSFFGPSWSGYNVIAIDNDYHYALVFGRNTDYMWLLSRDRGMPQEIKDKYLKMAEECGYDTTKIHWADQSKQVESFKP